MATVSMSKIAATLNSGTTSTSWQPFFGVFNVAAESASLSGTLVLEATPDGGSTVFTVESVTDAGIALTQHFQPERGWDYRFRLTSIASGAVAVRASN